MKFENILINTPTGFYTLSVCEDSDGSTWVPLSSMKAVVGSSQKSVDSFAQVVGMHPDVFTHLPESGEIAFTPQYAVAYWVHYFSENGSVEALTVLCNLATYGLVA